MLAIIIKLYAMSSFSF
uniref:Uncharacterized protein n=1 Tax=Anguilla anguilla TaxID=7936 RepID=A0A0E9QGU2_ANGAN